MLLCLSNGESVLEIYRYCQKYDMHADLIAMEDYPNLKTALSKNRSMANYDYVLFYFTGKTIPKDELLEAVNFIMRFYHARIIVFATASAGTSRLFGELFDMGIRELVAVSDDTDLEAEFVECVSLDGKSFADAAVMAVTAHIETARDYIRPTFEIPEDFRLTIAVAGTQSRIGVTTQAFSMYHALAALGFTPCIVDVKQSFIESLMLLYENDTERNGSILRIHGMDFAHDIQVGTGHNVFLYKSSFA